jgi:ABC-2 type transport system permease protein
MSLADPGTLRAAVGSVLYLALIALLSTGVAAIVRDPAVAIGAVLALLYVVPVIAAFIANPQWHGRLERYFPMAGLNIQATVGVRSLPITPWAGLGVLAVWAGAALLCGGIVLKLRDV